MPKPVSVNPGSVGHRLSIALSYYSLSQSDLAERSKYSKQAISQALSGKMHADGFLDALATALTVDPAWLKTGLGQPPWAATLLPINYSYHGLVQVVKQAFGIKWPLGLVGYIPDTIKPEEVGSPNWRPQPMPLLQLAKELGIKVEWEKTIIDSFRSRMPVPVAMAAAQALQMALATCDEQDREKFRAALNWIETATSE